MSDTFGTNNWRLDIYLLELLVLLHIYQIQIHHETKPRKINYGSGPFHHPSRQVSAQSYCGFMSPWR